MAEETVEAVKEALEKTKDRKFKQTIDLMINLKHVDLNDPQNRIDQEVVLPNGRGKKAKVGLFASGELAVKAKNQVDLLIKPEEIEDYADDKKEFKKIADEHNFFIAEAPLMPTIGKTLGPILGPRGKMPKPVPPGADIADTIKNLRDTVKVRSKTNKTFHTIVGTEDMKPGEIAENVNMVLKRVKSNLERGRLNIASVYVKTTMGPSVKVI
ncbi:MAG: 50S ribosomal protein L1 [Candidatus Thermoplasmatota archaeon]